MEIDIAVLSESETGVEASGGASASEPPKASAPFYKGIGHVGTRPVGGLDPDFCIRVTQRWPRKIVLYEPRAQVYHRVSHNRARWGYFCWRSYNEGLSKSLLTRRVGTRDGLASERIYTLRTLPRGVVRGVADTVLRGDPTGLARAGAIVVGLAITVAGYILGSLSQWVGPRNIVSGEEASA